MTRLNIRRSDRTSVGSQGPAFAVIGTKQVFASADIVTTAKIESLRLRDGLTIEQFLVLATEAYALMLPGWPYPGLGREDKNS
jgi:hypothetical protein